MWPEIFYPFTRKICQTMIYCTKNWSWTSDRYSKDWKWILILKNINDRSTAKFKLKKRWGDKLERWACQCDSLSPKRFAVVLEEVFRQLSGINVSFCQAATEDFRIILIFFTWGDIELAINISNRNPTLINNYQICFVDVFINLCQIISWRTKIWVKGVEMPEFNEFFNLMIISLMQCYHPQTV